MASSIRFAALLLASLYSLANGLQGYVPSYRGADSAISTNADDAGVAEEIGAHTNDDDGESSGNTSNLSLLSERSWPWKVRLPFSNAPQDQKMPPETFPERIEVEPLPESFKRYHHCYSKYIPIFGFPVIATPDVPDWMVEHAGNVYAQYLDSDADGVPDNPAIIEKMRERRSIVTMFMDDHIPRCHGVRTEEYDLDCKNDIPPFVERSIRVKSNTSSHVASGSPDYDASLEEILHLIMDQGYAPAYPDIFAPNKKSKSAIVAAMTVAIGDCGFAYKNTFRYPDCAGKYHYADKSCDFNCLSSEYIHWSLTTLLGGQDGSHANVPADQDRCKNIEHEWEMCTASLLRKYNPEIVEIYDLEGKNPYKVPSTLPDGNYKPKRWPRRASMELHDQFYRLAPSANGC